MTLLELDEMKLQHHTDNAGNLNRMELLATYWEKQNPSVIDEHGGHNDTQYLDIQSDCASVDNNDRISLLCDDYDIQEEIALEEVVDTSNDNIVVVPLMTNHTLVNINIPQDLMPVPEIPAQNETKEDEGEISLADSDHASTHCAEKEENMKTDDEHQLDLAGESSNDYSTSFNGIDTSLDEQGYFSRFSFGRLINNSNPRTSTSDLTSDDASASSNGSICTLNSAEPGARVAGPTLKTFGPRQTGLTSASQEQLLMQFMVTPPQNKWHQWWQGQDPTDARPSGPVVQSTKEKK